jgi:allantoicase
MPRETYRLDDVPAKSIPADEIDSTFQSKFIGEFTRISGKTPTLMLVDIITAPIGGKVISVSDEWFAPAVNLISPKPPVYSEKQVFTGQWMDGWESRRHNRNPFDYTIIRVGVASGSIAGIEIDTAFFQGNEAPAISLESCFASNDDEVISWQGGRGKWKTVLGKKECGPSSRHAWLLEEQTNPVTHVRLNMYPDGGIARFRLYGTAVPVLPDLATICDLAAATNGGLVVSCSEQAFGTRASNLLLPGRGPDMADGWETARSRTEDHVDWAIVKLGIPGKVQKLIIDTAHFRGNYPDQYMVMAINHEGEGEPQWNSTGWKEIMNLSKGAADAEREFLNEAQDDVFSHVKLNIYPDGGVKRLRVLGMRAI